MKHSITGEIELADDYSINIRRLFEEALKEVYGEATVEEAKRTLSPSLFKLTNDPLQHAVESTFKKPQFGVPEPDFLNEFKYNTGVFSAFKAHAEQELLVSMLLDEKGNLRSFHQFKKAVKGVNIKWNEQWLRTEYNTAVRSARSAANYRDALRSKEMYPNLEYIISNAREKRESHLELVGTIRPIEDPFWDTYLPPSDWNCACSVKPTDKPVTELPKVVKGVPPVFRNNPGKTAEFVKLDEHPYLKGKGLSTCPECRRQGLTTAKGEGEELCQMHQLAKAHADKSKLIAKRKIKFDELLKDPNYKDVAFDPRSGGLKATHVGHNFDRKKGWYERKVQDVAYKAGNEVILESEQFGKLGERFTDGTWNGKKFEIAAAETGTSNNIRKALNHCAAKRETEIAVVFFPKNFNMDDFIRGVARYKGIKKVSPENYIEFDAIIGITSQGELKIPSKDI